MEEKKTNKLARLEQTLAGLEYKMYRIVAFIISVYLMLSLLDQHIHISKLILTVSDKIMRFGMSFR